VVVFVEEVVVVCVWGGGVTGVPVFVVVVCVWGGGVAGVPALPVFVVVILVAVSVVCGVISQLYPLNPKMQKHTHSPGSPIAVPLF
jgi:hypothetical protein